MIYHTRQRAALSLVLEMISCMFLMTLVCSLSVRHSDNSVKQCRRVWLDNLWILLLSDSFEYMISLILIFNCCIFSIWALIESSSFLRYRICDDHERGMLYIPFFSTFSFECVFFSFWMETTVGFESLFNFEFERSFFGFERWNASLILLKIVWCWSWSLISTSNGEWRMFEEELRDLFRFGSSNSLDFVDNGFFDVL